ncbi:trinucleotide repeat-containing gene 6B protein isoform X2 [Periophthalmus magnuspinnatus]|uniref:trinucleotide repeat-containing gene 6B protein isoform X2 n=1 Tax=Periophthalmus magnuspinnatus TaxID=409849 RepID=UPI0024364514|nr:trinucleotide repeat-containing gene 6B protein isoform X2 [Periophthalmus magnuspinnatus]
MDDKKRKKDDKRKREASQKVIEQKNKVPDLTKPTSAQSPAAQSSSASPSPGPTPSASPSLGTPGSGSAAPSQGGNNAKRLLVANGQPASTSSSSSTTGGPSATGNGTSSSGGGAQTPQQQPRYMPREVPPRFRCQQDHKVLLKRGQPPLSSMLLGGGGGDSPNANLAVSDSGAAASSLALTSSSVAASTTSSNYANSMWGVSSGSQASSQGREKVIVDGNDLEEWPSIAGSEGGGSGGSNNGTSVNSTSASGNQPSPTSSFSLPNECMQSSSGAAWGTAASQGHLGGGSAVAVSGPSSLSKASTVPGSHDASGPAEGSSGIPGANLNPNANPSAWPALVQQDGPAASGEGGPSSFHHQGPGGPLSANNSASLGLGAGALGMLGGQSPLSVNQSSAHQHQLHQMQSRDGKWDSESVGPNTAGGEGPGGVMDRSGVGGDHSLVSSWRGQPSFPASNSKTGASRTDSWDTGGGTGVFVAAEGDNGTSGWGYPGSTSGVNAWGNVGGNTSQTSGVSQGGWGSDRGAPSSDWGGGEVKGGAASSNSGVGAAGNPPTSAPSSLSATMSRAWDNQKGEGESGEWVGGQGAQGGSSSSGGNSRAGSAPNSSHSRSRRQAPNAEAALQNLLNRSDLDPRVLSNTGWGQTQIRQNTTWDVEDHGQNKLGSKPSLSGGGSSQFPGSRSISESMVSSAGSSGEGWESSSNSSSSGASISGRGPPTSGPSIRNVNMSQSGPVSSSGPGVGPGVVSGPTQQGTATGWGRAGTGESQEAKGWGNEERRDARPGNGGGWGDPGQQGEPLGGGWGEGQEEKGTGGWKELGGDARGSGWGSGQKVRTGRDWGEQERKSNGGGWEDERKNGPGNSGGDSGVGGWGSWDESGPRRTWGAGGTGGGGSAGGGMGVIGSKSHQGWGGGNKMHQMPNSQSGPVPGPQAQLQQQQSQPRNQHPQQTSDQGVMQGAMGRKPMPPAHNQSSGWTSGPIPTGPAGSGPEPSGWDEPSPQSISRKGDIDDGTSAWGDPTNYNYKPVNLWDKNNPPNGPQSQSQGQTPHQPQGPTGQQPSNRPPPTLGANFSTAHGPGKAPALGPSGWGSTSPTSPTVDNGTAAWGKPTDAPTGWGDPDEGGKSTGWGSPSPNPIKSGSKSMQDGWGDKEGSVAASRHSSWEEEEEGGGLWNSAGSQGSGSSWGQGSNGGWGQTHTGKKPNNKGPLKSGDSWMGPLNRQFSNIGLLNDDPGGSTMDLGTNSLQDKKMDADKRGMGMSDYNGDMRKAGRGGVGMGYRSSGTKDSAPGDAGSFYDKGSHGIFGNVGGIPQSRHQPSVPPMNQSPGIRAQVPHQFLSPQVPGSVLKQMPPPSGSVGGVGAVGGVAGVGGGVFPPQLSPQHIAMLGIYPPHIQFQLACQLLLQQPQQQQQQQQLLQNQRKFTPNVRQQTDPQQLARIMAVLQQQRQQQQVGGLGGGSKLSPSHHTAGGMGPKMPGADPLSHSGLAASVADLQQKTHGPYSGFGSGVNLSGLDLGSSVIGGPGTMKDFGGQQSRFKWMMEGQSSPDSSHAENAFHKNGPVAPMKMPGGSPYSQYDMMVGDGLGDNWHRTPGNKMGAKATTAPSWPPEFQPGVPWKGIDRVDPDTDPYITPAMMGNAVSPGLNDSEHQLLDNTDSTPPLNTLLPSPGAWPFSASDSPLSNAHNSAKYTDFKTSWPPEPIGHKSWKANRGGSQSQLSRPPPGLASQKQSSPTPWSGGAPRLAGRAWGSGSGTAGTTWSDGSPRESCWLVLSNLTPQIDGSTLRTICMQHGPLLTFHLGLTQGSALIRYSSKQEAAKAQSALHMCVLGNTTILAEFVSEEDVARYIAHSQAGGAGSGGTQAGSAGSGPAAAPALGANGSAGDRAAGGSAGAVGVEAASTAGAGPNSSGWSLDSTGSSSDQTATHGPGLGVFAQWSSNGAGQAGGVEAGRQALWGGMGGMSGAGYHSNSLWGSPALEDRHQMGSPASLLPGDLLGGGADSI